MRLSRTALATTLLVVAVGAGTVWWFVGRPDATPLIIPASAFSSWTVVTSDGTDPWIVGAQPADSLTRQLLDVASKRAGRPLVAPPHPAVPLVLQSEFADSLQGVYGTDAVMRMAHDAGIESAVFAPVCLAHQTIDAPSGTLDVYFVPFEAPSFNQMRADLTPLEPEHAGIGIYDPATLTPALVIGATANAFDHVWPIRFDRARDCEAPIEVETDAARTGTGG